VERRVGVGPFFFCRSRTADYVFVRVDYSPKGGSHPSLLNNAVRTTALGMTHYLLRGIIA
jgi:hypothetical protein